MDRTSWIGVLTCMSLLFVWGWWNAKETTRLAVEQAARPVLVDEAKTSEPSAAPAEKTEAAVAAVDPASADAPDPKNIVLENDTIRIHLTNVGAGVASAELKEYPFQLGGEALVAINESATSPVGALSPGPKQFDRSVWKVVSESSTEVTFESTQASGVVLRKTIALPGADSDPYQIRFSLEVSNTGQVPFNLGEQYLYTGGAAPLHLNEWSLQIGSYWMEKDGDFKYKTVDHFGGRKILGVFGGSEKPYDLVSLKELHWAGVNDQFFTTIVSPDKPYAGNVWISRYPVTVDGNEAESRKKRLYASEAALSLPQETVAPGATATVDYEIYMGPKEFVRLKGLGDRRQRVMHYDAIPIFGKLFGWAIKPIASFLIVGLVVLEGWVGSFGLAIILITILIRLLIWPVYAKSARTMKRMSKLTPLMKELREKYADNPEKMNRETMELYRTYGINPLGGCLPMFIQLPVFLAFYRMLWSAVELRHESFLWVADLSMPDTLFQIPGLNVPFNLLPILMGVTSFVQMAITPKTGDKTQQTLFMMMPVVFIFICYNFASALALYWTTSNAFSILQTWMMNKMPEPELVKKSGPKKRGFMQRLAEQAEAAQQQQKAGAGNLSRSASRTKMPGEKGERHTKGKRKNR